MRSGITIKKNQTQAPPPQSLMTPCLKMRLSSGRRGKITIVTQIKHSVKHGEQQIKLLLKKNSNLKHFKYVYNEIFVKCLVIMPPICWLLLHLHYSHEKLAPKNKRVRPSFLIHHSPAMCNVILMRNPRQH